MAETESGSKTITQRGVALLDPILETVGVEGEKEASHSISSDLWQQGHRFCYVWIMVTEGTSEYKAGIFQVFLFLLSVVYARTE